ncbi:MAG: hypothetical protein FWG77_08690, partial [Treponema sp.]|nr:hypothetical protein [Treponema sp.]
KSLLVSVFLLLFSLPVYSQSFSDGNLFFSAAFGRVFFSENRTLELIDHLHTTKLDYLIVGGNWEWPFGIGYATIGLEAGYSHGSTLFSGRHVDKIPVNIRSSWVYPVFNSFYIGPSVKLGALGMLGPDRNRLLLLTGARLEAELRPPSWPLGIFITGGFDAHPTAIEPDIIPVFEAGLRFPRREPGARQTRQTAAAVTRPAVGQQSIQADGVLAALAEMNPEPALMTAQQEIQAQAAMAEIEAQGVQVLQADHNEFVDVVYVQGVETQGIMRPVYFEPDTAVLIEIYRPVLELVGQKLISDPELRLQIQAFAAPFRTEPGRYAVSENRAIFCKDYFIQNFGIDADRITYQAFGSFRLSPHVEVGHWETYRSAELIVYRN